ncbi:MAG: hypothetical protein ACK5DF_05895, partial [Bacteroidota bacterium]
SSFFADEYLFPVIKIAQPKQKVNNKLLVKSFAIDIFFGVVKEKIPNEVVLQYFPAGYLNSWKLGSIPVTVCPDKVPERERKRESDE